MKVKEENELCNILSPSFHSVVLHKNNFYAIIHINVLSLSSKIRHINR